MPEAPSDFRIFPKQWGAEFVGSGDVHFRIWAPGVDTLSLRLGDKVTPMSCDDQGWYEILASGVQQGSTYGFVLPDGRLVPDPASRAQSGDIHSPSLLVDPSSYQWRARDWSGRPWREAVIYELHVGTFTPEGTFSAAARKLDHLAGLGVTAVELMPVGQFPGTRGWGYDGVLPYAPHNAYGPPDALKALVDAAHERGLMMLLDVVYNHFGPEGNYLPSYAPEFFDNGRRTPWGAGIAYQRPAVRRFFIDNALYWVEEFNFDGLRLDAVDQIQDPSRPELLLELAEAVRQEFPERHIHLITEDNRNVTYLHERADGRCHHYTAEWNDDFHNAAHVVLTGESEGYYADFSADPIGQLARCLVEGFAFQGEPSGPEKKPRGEPSGHLPPTAFVDFLQNHDQIGNRARGERLSCLADRLMIEALTAILILSPHIPLIFMGEEWRETRPFLFFTDFTGSLAKAVRDGRRKEFEHFAAFQGENDETQIPDPNALETFHSSKLDWTRATRERECRQEFIQNLLGLRKQHIVPLLHDVGGQGRVTKIQDAAFAIEWSFDDVQLHLRANLGKRSAQLPPPRGHIVFPNPEQIPAAGETEFELAPGTVIVSVSNDVVDR
ncbi:malto-oligosyltrehalose trehalohydrolase [Mesorhizobium sp. CA8]|uniref:malto-oligosyltrehalose trehalohydrolase n=1 Tax=Mesorhizobium sp. CA8 TaxID=2876637 RepID=UPI001CCE4710|nr:malto-oligosyltrehalose trehalohydrolase [Mesorhizobium sp. CA8]MBZ9763946.1 malto-oligosyltrehalose trehalohydrolase [Mesorhizobium sp. CA8]